MKMEIAQAFVISKIKEIVNNIENLKILYKCDSANMEHLIKFCFLDVQNDLLEEIKSNFIFDFIDEFPYESLVFIDQNDDWLHMDEPYEIFTGINFKEKSSYNEDLWSFDNIEEDIFEMSSALDFYTKIINPTKEALVVKTNSFDDYYQLIENTEDCYCNQSKSNDKKSKIKCGCNNYALAA